MAGINFELMHSRIGNRYGHLTIIDFVEYLEEEGLRAARRVVYKTQCDCGHTQNNKWDKLQSGRAQTCGRGECNYNSRIIHGRSHDLTYKVYRAMLDRCLMVTNKWYKSYGGRGIFVTPRWVGKEGFKHFIEDMGERPSGTSIDRINNDDGYYKENCRWATSTQQQNNTRANVLITILNITKTAKEWAGELGISYSLLLHRLRRKWAPCFALWFPPLSPRGSISFSKVTKEVRALKKLKY